MSMHRTVGVYQPRSRRTQLADTIAAAREFAVGLVSATLRRALGLGLMLFALAVLGALFSYDPADPSLDVATWRTAGNWLGVPGAYCADLLFQSVGAAAFALPLPLASWGWQLISGQRLTFVFLRIGGFTLGTVFFAAGFGTLPQLPIFPALAGGIAGQLMMVLVAKAAVALHLSFLSIVIPIVLAVSGTALIVLSAGIRWRAIGSGFLAVFSVALGVGLWIARFRFHRGGRAEIQEDEEEWEYEDEEEFDDDDDDLPGLAMPPEPLTAVDFSAKRVRRAEDRRPKVKVKTRLQPALNLAEGEYQLPPLSLLTEPPAETTTPAYSDDALEENARLLEAVLSDFGVKGRIVAVRPGPVVTLYELEPAAGVKSSRIVSLSDDIARSMSAVAARVAVIPGRNVIGIELPNLRRETVYLRELFSATEYEKSRAPLTLALGKTIGGEAVMADLAKMPHLLIAGTTGSGKSVALNTMILSLLYRMPPEHCRIIMIDPKMLELSVYDNIPHLLTPVVIDPKKAVVALKWAVREMEQRYSKMAKIGVRGVEAFNERVKKAKEKGEVLKRTVQTGFDRETGRPVYEDEILELEPMPFIVVVVDEMADLMMISGKEIEGAVQRLAQMARAAGIHLIAATQRPSVDVITGTIKANFPTRISFQVTSKIDSRTILGEQGAEQLLGQGDMLYMMAGGRIRRVHGPFVSDSEVEEVVRFLKTQGQPDYLDAVTQESDDDEEDPYGLYGNGESGDELYDKAIAVVANERKVSTSYIQRRLQIGYNRAARLIERMEEDGMISKPNHQGKREIMLPEGRN
jgi:S-DNA-T family DNA segregation ATPase FtsK/SpoIIIE